MRPFYVVHDTLPYVVQPDYALWKRIKPGMTEEEVEAILGKPISRENRPNRDEAITIYRWNYGEIDFNAYTVPSDFSFEVWFKIGKVHEVGDPFFGELSEDGKPTTPKPISPLPNTAFSHYPRYIDFRWHLSSGRYPMKYEIEIQTEMGDEWSSQKAETRHPYYPHAHGGKNAGRWRICAVNEFGKSVWTEWMQFTFDR